MSTVIEKRGSYGFLKAGPCPLDYGIPACSLEHSGQFCFYLLLEPFVIILVQSGDGVFNLKTGFHKISVWI